MKKKKLLIFPFDLLSHYLRCITLATHYKEYDVFFAASPTYDAFVKQAGYGTFTVEGFDPAEVMECTRAFNFNWLKEKNIARVFNAQVEVIKKLNPDLVIGDTAPTLKMAAEYTGVEYHALMNGYMTKYYGRVRKVSRTHYSYKHVSRLPEGIADRITAFAEGMAFKAVHKPFRLIRRRYNLKKLNHYLDELEGDKNLICDDPALFPQKNLPSTYRFIGALTYVSKDEEQALLASLDPMKPTVCVCMGSTGNLKEISFLSDTKYSFLNVIVAGDTARLLKGPHIHHKAFINLDAVLPKCQLLICHGGNGTIYEGIRHQVPMLCLTSHFEQEWNVHMLELNGVGKLINDSPQELIDQSVFSLKPVISSAV